MTSVKNLQQHSINKTIKQDFADRFDFKPLHYPELDVPQKYKICAGEYYMRTNNSSDVINDVSRRQGLGAIRKMLGSFRKKVGKV